MTQDNKQFANLKQSILALLKKVETILLAKEDKIDNKTILLFSKLIDNFIKIVSVENKLTSVESVDQDQLNDEDRNILKYFRKDQKKVGATKSSSLL